MSGHACPQCGTPRGRDGGAGAGCDCAERAADAVQAERRAEMAAAEDFNPLRIRPYVTLEAQGSQEVPGSQEPPPAPPVLPAMTSAPSERELDLPSALTTVPIPLQQADPASLEEPVTLQRGEPPRRRRPLTWLFAGAAVVVVTGTAAFAGGLFAGDDEPERALPDRATSTPSLSAAPDAPSASPSKSAGPSRSPSASKSASRTPSATPTPSRTAPTTSAPAPTPTTPPPTTPQPTATTSQPPTAKPPSGTLRRGDSGPEVAELQERLAAVWAYGGPVDGQYSQSVEDSVRWYQWDRGVRGDPEGVYGPKTRRELEWETEED
ncbi:peptidoglycan-binding protein [Streptomyces sp. NPDC051907]|uniref:peptidoglycan-binding domain-containing protein n=1 Tax=Streptomyces sp. NPDC051907 TaxID=3155284 RepID=UPI00342F2DBF